jgi:anaerobic magnesium-protoporphyrin IX monomethyl ester cyclase
LKVFILQSYLGRSEKPIFPLGLAYLAANLKEHELECFDPNVSADPYGELAHRLKKFQPDVVGISLRNVDTTQYRDPFVYLNTLQPTLDLIESCAPTARRVIGGAGFSIYAHGIMERFPSIDFGVLLEGEESFPALLKNIEDPKRVSGIYYRTDNQVLLSGPPSLPDFDTLLSPKWDIVEIEPYKGQLDTFGVQAKRGCGLKCAYCTYFFLNGAYYRLRSPEKVVEEIAQAVRELNLDHFIFVDSIFNIPVQHARDICEELIRRKINVPWTAWYNDREFDADFMSLAKNAGCRYYSFSPDAYSDRSLKLLQKNLRVEDIDKVLELGKRDSELHFGFNFFVNPPGQTYWDFMRLLFFWMRVRFELRGRLYGFGMGNIRIEPDTEILRIAVEEGVVAENTELLALTSDELAVLFYTNPSTPLVNHFFKLYGFAAKIKHTIRP